jgi:hypothetical protein
MLPNRAVANAGDQFMAGTGTLNPAAFAAPNLPPPNPALGERMRQRDWAGREAQAYYEMGQAPNRNQFTYDRPHPLFGGGNGNPATQYQRPHGPPTGLAARGMSRSALDAWTPQRPGVGYVRPTQAYNRVVGRGKPTMYATWPSQYYPGGSNTYIPSWEATGLIIKYTRNQSYFRVNKYVKDIKVPRDQGYYLTLGAEDPYRVVSINDYLWEDSTDAPGGRQERQAFGFLPYRTARYCFPFNLGRKSVQQAEWPILAEHAQMAAAKAMTVRTLLNTALAALTTNWSGTWGSNFSAVSAQWSNMASNTTNAIQSDINTAMIAIEQASGGIVTDEEALQLTLNPVLARGIAKSFEYKQYIQGSPDALAAITDQRNPNRKYGLAPFLYGLRLVVENAIVVTTPKSGNVPTQPAQSRSYVWSTGNVVLSSKPTGITAPDEQTLDFSTFCFRFYEQMTTEQKSDPDNRREVGRVVEDYVAMIQAPQTGYLLTGAS